MPNNHNKIIILHIFLLRQVFLFGKTVEGAAGNDYNNQNQAWQNVVNNLHMATDRLKQYARTYKPQPSDFVEKEYIRVTRG